MKTIHKFVLPFRDVAEVDMPVGAKVLSAGNQNGKLCVWAEVNVPPLEFTTSERAVQIRRFRVAGTGHPLDDFGPVGPFVGTVIFPAEQLVFHVYEMARV